MILRYSRDILFRYPRAFFAFILELKAISFQLPPRVFIFLYFSPPFTSHLFACYPFQSGSPPVYFLSIQLTSAFPSRCTLHPFPLSSSFRYSFSISHISSFHFPFARSFLLYIYIRVWVSRSQPYSCLANEADILERKNLCQKSSERSCHCRLDCPSKMYFFFMEYVAN